MAKKQSDSKIAVAGALALALALAGVALVKEQLQSSRPVGTGLEMKQTTGEQLVRARLWEDPLEAVQRGIKEIGETEKPAAGRGEPTIDVRVATLRHAIQSRASKGQQITVLFVTTAGGPYVESTESRIRDRYAIGAALGVSCYVPERQDNLMYVGGKLSEAIPYEWYVQHATRVCDPMDKQHDGEQADSKKADRIVVIWLSDEVLREELLTTVRDLSQALICKDRLEGGQSRCMPASSQPKLVGPISTPYHNVVFKIIGPRSSSALRAMLKEARLLDVDSSSGTTMWLNQGGTIELYSPWATVMKGLLGYGLDTELEAGREEECRHYETCKHEFHQRLKRAGIRLVYDIGADDLLFEELVDELERRQVRLGWDAIILLGEWDSFYGRALPIEFQATVCARVARLSKGELKEIEVPDGVQSRCPTVPKAIDLQIQRPADYQSLNLNVFRYSYLSGLDGEIPGDDNRRPGDGTKKVARTAKAKNDTQQKEEQRDRPEGTSQIDYVRALVDRIRSEGQGARAIGIFGSDPYDSLLIIRALRPAFPHAIFFTVDLDARYLHPSEYKWTRNLVIASPFGLRLERDLQPNVPPFRSSYQTSAYFATIQAVGYVGCRQGNHAGAASGPCVTGYQTAFTPDNQLYDAGSHPRLFEVGRGGAVDLSIVKTTRVRTIHPLRPDLAQTDLSEPDLDPTNDYGQLKQGVVFSRVGAAVAGVATIVVGLVVVWTNQRIWSRIERYPRVVTVVVVLMALFTVLVLASWTPSLLEDHDAGEPFAWIDGVSVWPSELLRLIVVVLSMLLFLKGARDLIKNGEQIRNHFHFEQDSEREPFSPATFWTNLQRVYHPVSSKTTITVGQAWAWYQKASRFNQGMVRTALLFLLYLGVMWAIEEFVLNDEFIQPCRGWLSCQVDSVMTWASVGIVVLLNLAVFDAAILCRSWIGWITTATGGWSDRVQEKYLEEYGLGLSQRGEFEKVHYVAVVDLIAQRTEVVNRLIRYPFLALLIMMAARNEYFDIWNYPTLFLVSWSVNVFLALLGALLLYQAASRAKEAMLAGLNRQMIQTYGTDVNQDIRAKQMQHIIGEVEGNQKGAFVPLYQQPVIESSLYGVVALLQYLYLS